MTNSTIPARTNAAMTNQIASITSSFIQILTSLLTRLPSVRHSIGVDRELDGVAFNGTDQLAIDVVVMTLVSRTAVLLCQLDAIPFDAVDGRAVLANDFHVFPDVCVLRSNPVFQSLDACLFGAMVAAEEGTVLFKSMSDDATAAVFAFRGKGVNGTFKAIKDVLLAAHDDCERFVVVVSAIFAGRHLGLLAGSILGFRCRSI
jgi:hypothetical protein